MTPAQRTKQAEKSVAQWNAAHGLDTPVEYRSHPSAAPLATNTCSPAWVLGGHSAVVMVEEVRGCVALSALRVVAVVPASREG